MAYSYRHEFYARTKNEEDLDEVLAFINDKFRLHSVEKIETDAISGEILSDYPFPKEEMNRLTERLENKEYLYIRNLTTAFESDYTAMYLYRYSEWRYFVDDGIFNNEPKKYILVSFPEIQFFMEHERFDECLFINRFEGHVEVPDSSYMVPEDLYNEFFYN